MSKHSRSAYTSADKFYKSSSHLSRQADLEAAFRPLGSAPVASSKSRNLAIRFAEGVKSRANFPYLVGVFKILFGCLFFYLILFVLSNVDRADSISFQWFLQLLQNAPSVDMSWLYASDNLLLNDWGVFEWAKLPFNWIIDLLRPFGLIAHGIAQLASYLGYFLYSIFGVIGG